MTGTTLGTRDASSQPQAPHGWGRSGAVPATGSAPGEAERALPLPQPRPRSAPRPGAHLARPPGPRAAPGTVERGGGCHRPLTSPAAGIYLAGEPALPGPAPPAMRLPGDKGEGALSGALTPSPSGQAGGSRYTAPAASEPGAGGRHLSSGSETAPSAQPPCGPGPSRDAVT